MTCKGSVGCVCDPVEVPRDDCDVECNAFDWRHTEVVPGCSCSDCRPRHTKEANTNGGNGHPEYLRLLDELRATHLEKSGGYGTEEDPFANFTAVARHNGRPAYAYAVDRVIEKLERWKSLFAQGRFEELGEEHLDAASLLLCAEALRRTNADDVAEPRRT